MSEAQAVIGIDLGGTKIYAAIVDPQGKILATSRKRTRAELGFEAVVDRIVGCAKEAIEISGLKAEEIPAVGIGSPGPLDLTRGRIIETPNLGWKNAPIRDALQQKLERPVMIDNDGNVGLL
ncbi:ROK family protein, partial [candidate division KSB1 bacterium]|nr:ROK family protein [candidate division KSB1 bacterium]